MLNFKDALREMVVDGFVIKVTYGDTDGFIYFNKSEDEFYSRSHHTDTPNIWRDTSLYTMSLQVFRVLVVNGELCSKELMPDRT